MFKRKSKYFINDTQARKVRKEIVRKRRKGNSVEEGHPNEFLRSLNSLMQTVPPDMNKMLK